jgi:hypothetical protein
MGSLISRSYSALRGWNQARSLLAARSAMNWMAWRVKPGKVADDLTMLCRAWPPYARGASI